MDSQQLLNHLHDMDYLSLLLISLPIAVLVVCGFLLIERSTNDTLLQRCGSKASQGMKSHKDHQPAFRQEVSNANANANANAGTSGALHSPNTSNGLQNAKQRKSRSSSKRQDTNNTAAKQKHRAGTAAGINDWLQRDMVYCYERRCASSCAEDNMMTMTMRTMVRHNPAHRNSTSSDAAASDDLNSSSSNEDSSGGSYAVMSKAVKKSTKSRQKRQQKRTKQQSQAALNAAANLHPEEVRMDIDEESKENQQPSSVLAKTGCAGSLRKQITKAAALKATLSAKPTAKNNNGGKNNTNVLTPSAFNTSVCSSLSSASSTSSISSSDSSSAASSPMHSANSSPTATKRNADSSKKAARVLSPVPPLRQFTKLHLDEFELIQHIRRYIIDPDMLRVYGFPVDSLHNKGCVEFYKCLPKHLADEAITKNNQRHHCHYYGRKSTKLINSYDGLFATIKSSRKQQWYLNSAADSGHDSGDSSPRSIESDASDTSDDEAAPLVAFYTPDGVYQMFSGYDNSIEKQCVRCQKMFQVTAEGEYLTFESCTFHWGKVSSVFNGKRYVNQYSCCQREENSEGCTHSPRHVWTGAVVGMNGPFTDFEYTRPRLTAERLHKMYAVDCEMSFTGRGLEVTKVTVVGYDGSLVYERFVRPQAEIVDYNTRFSGITEKDLCPETNSSVKTFEEVRQDLLQLFDADTILIGHGLDNDLRVLRIVHTTVVDTSLIFAHSTGYPYRRSLKNLTKSYLKRDIQCGDEGHSSFEDSRACLELMMWKVRKDMRYEQN